MEKLNYKWGYLVLEDDNMDLDVYSGGLVIEPLEVYAQVEFLGGCR